MVDEPQAAWGNKATNEPRWPASVAVLFAIGLYWALPGRYTIGPSWLMPLLELTVLIPLSISAPHRVAHESPAMRGLAIAMIGIVNFANLASLMLLIRRLIYHASQVTGTELLYSSIGIWLTNVLVFALWYWELDRGGPDERAQENRPAPDFLFPQMSTPGCTRPNWAPRFIDYLYLAFTNSTAFSPTDVLPLSRLAKLLMLIQSAISLITITLAAARAVNILN